MFKYLVSEINSARSKVLKVLEVLLICVLLQRKFSLLEISTFVGMWIESLWLELWCAVGVTLWIVLNLFLLSEVPHEFDWIATPDLASGDESAWLNDRVGKNLSSSLDSYSLTNDWALAYDYIIIYDWTVDCAIWLNGNILSNVNWGS